MLRWITQLGWLFLCVSITSQSDASTSLLKHKSRYTRASQRLQKLQGIQKKHFKRVQRAARQLSILKKQARRGGLFALPSRMRLPKVRAQAQRLTQKMRLLTRNVYQQNRRVQSLRKMLLQAYKKQMKWLHKQIKTTPKTAARRIHIQRALRLLRLQHQQLKQQHKSHTQARRRLSAPNVRVHPLDGPRELHQKVDRIRDAEDHVKRTLRKLQKKIHSIQRKIKRRKNERKLEQFVDSSSDELFNEDVRNPRVSTGQRTSQKRLVDGHKGAEDQGSKQGLQPTPTNPTPPNLGSGKKPGYVGREQRVPTTPSTHTRSNLGILGVTGSSKRQLPRTVKGLTLNPSGSLTQQLKTLQLYKLYLKKQARQLSAQQSLLLQRAQRLRRERRRRRR